MIAERNSKPLGIHIPKKQEHPLMLLKTETTQRKTMRYVLTNVPHKNFQIMSHFSYVPLRMSHN
jgi:hypothetical protein